MTGKFMLRYDRTLSHERPMFPTCRDHSVDSRSKPVDWFQFDENIGH